MYVPIGHPQVAQRVENLPAMRDLSSIPGSGRFPGEGNGYPLQYSCLGNPMDRKSLGQLQSTGSQNVRNDWVTNTHTNIYDSEDAAQEWTSSACSSKEERLESIREGRKATWKAGCRLRSMFPAKATTCQERTAVIHRKAKIQVLVKQTYVGAVFILLENPVSSLFGVWRLKSQEVFIITFKSFWWN